MQRSQIRNQTFGDVRSLIQTARTDTVAALDTMVEIALDQIKKAEEAITTVQNATTAMEDVLAGMKARERGEEQPPRAPMMPPNRPRPVINEGDLEAKIRGEIRGGDARQHATLA